MILDGRHGAALSPVDVIGQRDMLWQTEERADMHARVETASHVQAGSEQVLSELLDSPVGERVQAESVGVDAVAVVVVVLHNGVHVLLEYAEAVVLQLGAQILLALTKIQQK